MRISSLWSQIDMIITRRILLPIFIFSFLNLSAQNSGGITSGQEFVRGKIQSEDTKESITNASISLEGTSLKTVSDIEGNFEIDQLLPGSYTINVTASGFQDYRRTIKIEASKSLIENIFLVPAPKIEGIGAVDINVKKNTNKESSVIFESKQAKQVMVGISRQQITQSVDGNAAQAMKRVPGITIVDGKFIMIRGLNERYNSVLINNVAAPSTEVDKRTFSFDLIPSGALDRMMILKSGSPENPGDFAGGVIKVYTNNVVEKNFTQINLGTGFRTQTTFQDYKQSKGSATDILGFDNGYRKLPSNFPTLTQLGGGSGALRQEAGQMLENNFEVRNQTAIPDFNLGFTIGRNFKLFGMPVSNISSANLNQSFTNYERDFNRYWEYDPILEEGKVRYRFQFKDQVYEKQNRLSLMSNFTFTPSNKTKIRFSNLFNQIGENETNIRTGKDFVQTLGNGSREHFMLGYRSRSIYLGQINGEHLLSKNNQITWVGGMSYIGESEPDLRRFRTYFAENDQKELVRTMIDPPSSNLFDASRYFGTLNEYMFNGSINYNYTVPSSKKEKIEINTGYYAEYKNRDFSSRYISYLIPGSILPERKQELVTLPINQIFSKDNIDRANGWLLAEGTRRIDSYTARNVLNAAYISTVIPVDKWNFSGGLRAEYNVQQLFGATDTDPIEINNPVLTLLPFFNSTYTLNAKKQVRLSYGKTVNRPEFRELAPFVYYDYRLDASKVGEPSLKNSNITNIDLRYEYYPRLGELISFGVFYKYFDNPIENKNIITSELPTFTFINADYAVNYGAEIEIRKSLKGVTNLPYLRRLNFNINAAYIYSLVNLGEAASAQIKVRPLQGQSPYILNAIMGYNYEPKKITFNVAYNIFGARLFAIGDNNNTDIYELPRHSIDLTVNKSFKGYNVKLGIQDLLNYQYRFFQDTERNGSVDTREGTLDRSIFSYRRGTLISLSINIDLH